MSSGSEAHGDVPTANLIGALLIGLVASSTEEGGPIDGDARPFINTGIMGRVSTFGTLIWGTLMLLGEPVKARVGLVYLAVNLTLGIALVEPGLLGRSSLPRPPR